MKLSIASYMGSRLFMAVEPADPASQNRERARTYLRMLKAFAGYPLGQGTFSTYFHGDTKLKGNGRAMLHSVLQSIDDKVESAVIKALTVSIRLRLQEMTAIDGRIQAIADREIKPQVMRELGLAPQHDPEPQHDRDNLIDRKISERLPQDERFQTMEKQMVELLHTIEEPLNDLIGRLEDYLK